MKKIFLTVFILLFSLNVYADVHKTVKESGGDYTTMDACADGEAGDLSALGNVYCEASGTFATPDSTTVTISGYTNGDDTHRLYLTALDDGARHDGHSDSNNYKLSVTGFSQNGISGGSVKYVTVEYLEIISNGSGNGSGILPPGYPNDQGWIVRKNIVHGFTGGYCLKIDGSGNGSYYLNNTFYDCSEGVHASDNTSVVVENNTIHSVNTYGINIFNGGGGGAVFKNNLVTDSGTADYTSFADSTHNNNASSDSSGDITGYVSTDQYTDESGRNLLLKSGADAIDAGADLSATFTDDIDDTTRPQNSVYDIGSDEYEAGSPPATFKPRIINL